MGVSLHAITEKECVSLVAKAWDQSHGGWLHTINLDHLRRLYKGTFLPTSVGPADLRVCDGLPMVWASRLQGTPLPERVAGSNMVRSLTAAAAKRQRRIFFLGGNPGTAEGAKNRLLQETPGFQVAGVHCPNFGFEKDPQAMVDIADHLRNSKPDLVFVALGAPKSEALIQNWRHLAPNAWWVGVGISFSFITGEVSRAPMWMQQLGLEWWHRLMQEPRRLGRRYLLQGIPFALHLFTDSCRKRLRRG